MDNLKVAAVCMNVRPRRVEENLDRIHSFVLEASGEGADVICFPELCVTGYTLKNPGDIYDHGPDSDQAIARLVRMSKETGLIILAGLTEDSGQGHPFISHVIAGPDGLIGIYRKTHLSPHEKNIYSAGEKIEIYPYKKTIFGVQLCYEAHFPEISTVMAIMGADIIFLPHASPRGDARGKLNSWLRHLTARAFDNGVFVVACNQVGDTEEGLSFPGIAVVLGPDGQVLAKQAGDKETILYASLEARMLEDIRKHRMKYFIPRRRPELYGKIIQKGKSQ
jgi:predicted amidohydrolase